MTADDVLELMKRTRNPLVVSATAEVRRTRAHYRGRIHWQAWPMLGDKPGAYVAHVGDRRVSARLAYALMKRFAIRHTCSWHVRGRFVVVTR